MTETLYRILAPYFVCGVIVENAKVIGAAPIVAYMAGKSEKYLLDYCKRKNWKVEIC